MLSSAVLVLATMVVGQVDSSKEGEDLLNQFARDFVGDWVSKDIAKEDFLDVTKIGDTEESTTSIKWIYDKQALSAKWTYRVNGKDVVRGTTLIAWDAEMKTLREFGAASLGGVAETKFTKKDGKWVFETKIVLPNGMRMFATDTCTITDNGDTQIHVYTKRVGPDGKKQADLTSTVKRVKK